MYRRRWQVSCLAIYMATTSLGWRLALTDEPALNPSATTESREDRTGATYYQRLRRIELNNDEQGIVRISVRGVVRDQDGDPVAGAIVALRERSSLRLMESVARPIEDQKLYFFDDVLARTESASDGSYELIQVPASKLASHRHTSCTFEILAARKDGQFGWSELERSEMLEIERQQNIKLQETKPIGGKLLTRFGDPVAGAEVFLGTLDPVEPKSHPFYTGLDRLQVVRSSFAPRTRTDTQGRFEFSCVPVGVICGVFTGQMEDGRYFKRLATETEIEVASKHERLSRGAVASPATLRPSLPRPVKAQGVVVSESGEPLSGFNVSFDGSVRYTETDDDGRFKYTLNERTELNLTDRENKPIQVLVRARRRTNYLPKEMSFTLEQLLSPGGVKIILQKGVGIEGKVLTRDLHPVPDVQIAPSFQFQNVVTDRDGRYRMVVPSGQYRLRFFRDLGGYDLPAVLWKADEFPVTEKHFSISFDATGGQPKRLPTLLVNKFDPVAVHCINSRGEPVANAIVSAVYVPRPEDVKTKPLPYGKRREKRLAAAARSDSEGNCVMQFYSDTWVGAEVRAELVIDGRHLSGHATLGRNVDGPVIVTLSQPWSLSGRVTVNGIPKPSVFVQLRRSSFDIDAGPTNGTGEYSFTISPGDVYRVVAESPIDGSKAAKSQTPRRAGDQQIRIEDIDFTTADARDR